MSSRKEWISSMKINELTAVTSLPVVTELPDPFLFPDQSVVSSPDNWTARAEEISDMYQYYMYGIYRDGSGETLLYNASSTTLSITIQRNGISAAIKANVHLPNKTAPTGGWPVIICFNKISSEDYAVSRDYAVITLDTNTIAEDSTTHVGAFYTLYPYGNSQEEQTGVLLAWSWGACKVMDALQKGAGLQLKIDPVNSMIAGVSRWGKAALVCGAFDKRFKMVVPSCAGAGGTALFRYLSKGKTYDFSSIGGPNSYTYSENEPFTHLQLTDERCWLNDNFLKFTSAEHLPFDQHMLGSLCADPNRYLFIIGACIKEDWINAPSMWLFYKASKRIFDYLGLGSHIAVNLHLEGHDILQEDMIKMLDYFDFHVYRKAPATDLSALTTSVFDLPGNYDPIFDHFDSGWKNSL